MTNVEVKPVPDVLPEDWVQRARKLSTTLLSDVVDTPPEMDYKIKPCNIDSVLVGSAVTVDVNDGDNLAVHHAIYQAQPGHVLVVSAGAYEKRAIIGELMASAAAALNLSGFVIDGLIRDYHMLAHSSFPVFSRGAIPGGPTKNGPGMINGSVFCGGKEVEPGDFIMGDADGVIVLPRHKVEEALNRAEEKAAYEQTRLKDISEGKIKPKWL
ncbi:RraA family protein [Alkalihalobacillus sp. NPDC078783]